MASAGQDLQLGPCTPFRVSGEQEKGKQINKEEKK